MSAVLFSCRFISRFFVLIVLSTGDFYGGQAHSGIADQAEKLWDCAGGIVKNALEENPGYNFVITGHRYVKENIRTQTLVSHCNHSRNKFPAMFYQVSELALLVC